MRENILFEICQLLSCANNERKCVTSGKGGSIVAGDLKIQQIGPK